MLAFHRFQNGIYLDRVSSYIPLSDIRLVSETIQAILSITPKALVTPYVLSEFHSLACARGGLNDEGVINLVSNNLEILSKFEEIVISKSDILNMKIEQSLHFCFTDTSLMLAASRTNMPILIMDNEFWGYCDSKKIPSLNLYYECVLGQG
jgi:hypothetical protein